MGSAQEAFERTSDGVWILAGVWVHHQICIRRFAEDGRCKLSVGKALNLAIEECYCLVLFKLNSELDSRMNFVETS